MTYDPPFQSEEAPIAKKSRRRPTAGPPPVKNPRHDTTGDGPDDAARRRSGEPIRPTMLSVVVRSILAIAVFVVITTATGSSLGQVWPIAVVLLVVMVVFGFWFDKWFYRWRMKRWEARRGGRNR